MLAHPTLEQLHALGLHGLAKGFKELEHKPEARGLDHARMARLMLETSYAAPAKAIRNARASSAPAPCSRIRTSIIETRAGSTAPCSSNSAPATGSPSAAYLLLHGGRGLGKSWLACALGQKACRENMSVLYIRMPRLFADLAIAHGDARYGRLLRSIARVKLLILDDWGPESLTPDQARDLLEIVEDRYDKGSLVITSQVPVDRWHDMIGVPTLADAILDRIVHNAYRVDLAGESLRKRQTSPKPKHS